VWPMKQVSRATTCKSADTRELREEKNYKYAQVARCILPRSAKVGMAANSEHGDLVQLLLSS
jgi:hypothetical protein